MTVTLLEEFKTFKGGHFFWRFKPKTDLKNPLAADLNPYSRDHPFSRDLETTNDLSDSTTPTQIVFPPDKPVALPRKRKQQAPPVPSRKGQVGFAAPLLLGPSPTVYGATTTTVINVRSSSNRLSASSSLSSSLASSLRSNSIAGRLKRPRRKLIEEAVYVDVKQSFRLRPILKS